jgi:fructose-bisphosphate aldolase class I
VGRGLPSAQAIAMNAQDLARYASICQRSGLVPIVEVRVKRWREHGQDVPQPIVFVRFAPM